jgi:membrane protein DedA with SNARE-associated domain
VPGEGHLTTIAFLQDFITEQVQQNGYLAVFVLMVLDTACIPIPSEIVLMFGGAMASSTFAAAALGSEEAHLSLVLVIAAGLAGSLLGSWLAYWIGYAGGRPLIDKWGRYLLFRPHEVDRAHEWFERHGEILVCFGRVIPLLRAFVSLPAGIARMNFGKFTLYTILGIVPWTIGLTFAGYALGERWTTVERRIAPISIAVGIALLMALTWWVSRRLRERANADDLTDGEAEEPTDAEI